MSRKIIAVIGALIIIVLVEGWVIFKTENIQVNVIPLNSYIFHNGDEWINAGYADNYVAAEGTWISDTTIANPIQSSYITCLRDSMKCIEARGEISSDGYLIVNSFLFDVETWNKNEITTKPDDSALGCTRYTMRLDRIQKQVTATRITTDTTSGRCNKVDKKRMHLLLSDEFEAWSNANNAK